MKTEVKAWLKENRLSREWLAGRLNVSKPTVDNWLSTDRGIPAKVSTILSQMMDDSRKQAAGIVAQIFSVECSLDQFRTFSRAALHQGKTLEDWALWALEHEANEWSSQTPETDTGKNPLAALQSPEPQRDSHAM